MKEEFNPSQEYKPRTTIPVFYSTSCEDWTAMEDSSQESFQGSQLPILVKGSSYGSSLIPLTGKQYKRNTGRNPLYPSSYKPPYLSPTCSTTQCQTKLFGKALKCKNKKQEARGKKKFEQKKVEGKSLDSRKIRWGFELYTV